MAHGESRRQRPSHVPRLPKPHICLRPKPRACAPRMRVFNLIIVWRSLLQTRAFPWWSRARAQERVTDAPPSRARLLHALPRQRAARTRSHVRASSRVRQVLSLRPPTVEEPRPKAWLPWLEPPKWRRLGVTRVVRWRLCNAWEKHVERHGAGLLAHELYALPQLRSRWPAAAATPPPPATAVGGIRICRAQHTTPALDSSRSRAYPMYVEYS